MASIEPLYVPGQTNPLEAFPAQDTFTPLPRTPKPAHSHGEFQNSLRQQAGAQPIRAVRLSGFASGLGSQVGAYSRKGLPTDYGLVEGA